MTVAELIVRRLCDAGVVTLFGMPGGGSNLDLIDAAGRVGLPFVLTATETGAAIAALAQTEITGGLGACLTTLGPGVSSIVNGVACAYLDRAPIVVLTDCHPASAGSAEHQRLDHRALLSPVTKWSATLSAENAEGIVQEAAERALAGTRGPVHIDIPSDVIGRAASPAGPRVGAAAPPSASVARFPESRRPLLLIGLRARRAEDAAAIRAFCQAHHLPALVTYKAKGVVPDDDPHFAGVLTNGAIERQVLERADLFVGVGLDSVELLPRSWTYPQPMVSITGSIAEGLAQLSERLTTTTWNLDEVRERVAAERQQLVGAGEGLTPDAVVATAARVARDVRVTVDAGAHMFPATMLWPVRQPNGMLISNGLSTMGFALPAAIGAALVDRERPVVALTGDGGLLMCAGELLTAARECLRVTTIVFSDASLSLIAIKQRQRKLTATGVTLGEVAWCALAESLGVTAHAAESADALETALAKALAAEGPSLIEARVDPSSYADVLRAIRG